MDETSIINNMRHNESVVIDLQKKLYSKKFIKLSIYKKYKLKKIDVNELINRTIKWFSHDQKVHHNYEVVKLSLAWLLDGQYNKDAESWGIEEKYQDSLFGILVESCCDFRSTAFILNIQELPQMKYKIFIKSNTEHLDKYILVNILLHELMHTLQKDVFQDKELKILEKYNLVSELKDFGWSREYEAYKYAFDNTLKCLKEII